MRRTDITISLALVVLAVLLYLPTLHNGFVNYDDHAYVLLNPQVQAGITWNGVEWAFTTMNRSNWHPLTWLSHMMDCQFYGLNPGRHHATNLLLHALNSALLYLVLRRMTGATARSAAVAVLFAAHPLHVESVAWIAERKDVLSTFFWMLTLLAYDRYVRNPTVRRYAAVMAFLALGLMAKPMLVTVPCVLLILDAWPLGRYAGSPNFPARWRRLLVLIKEKAPLFALVGISSVITLTAQNRGGALVSPSVLPMGARLGNAAIAYVTYLGKVFWPVDLSVIYPHQDATPPSECIAAIVLLTAITLLAARFLGRGWAIAGWLWYLGTLVPVIGLVQVGEQAMADRYTYVPLIGVFVALVWGAADGMEWLLSKSDYPGATRAVLGALAVTAWAACVAATLQQERYWRDTETLFEHALQVTRNNHLAHNGLGIALFEKGRIHEAIREHQEALRIKPDFPEARNALGIALARLGRFADAVDEYHDALRLKPDDADTHNNLGVAYARLGKSDESIAEYRKALQLNPDHANAHNNLGVALSAQGGHTEAMEQFSEAVRLRPDFAEAHNNLGIALAGKGRVQDGIDHYQAALRLKPDYVDAHYNLGIALGRQGRMLEASEQFRTVLRLKPDHAGAQKLLQAALDAEARTAGSADPKR